MNTTASHTEQTYTHKPIVKRVAIHDLVMRIIESEIEKESVAEVTKELLLTLIWTIERTKGKESTEMDYQVLSALEMFYTMLEEGRIKEVNEAFVHQFPEYYTVSD